MPCCSYNIVFRRSNSLGVYQSLVIAPGLLIGMLALMALVITLVSSEAVRSKNSVIFRS